MTGIKPASLDTLLTDALRPAAIAAPMPEALLRVPDGWVRDPRSARSPGLRFKIGVVAAAALVTVGLVTVSGALGERAPWIGSDDAGADVGVPIESLDLEALPGQEPATGMTAVGPVVEVARGEAEDRAFMFTVYRAEPPQDACIEFEWASAFGGVCGSMPGEGPTGGEFGGGATGNASAGVAHEVFGLVASNVAEVWIETDTGERARAQLVPLASAEIDADLFFAFLPSGTEASAWVALDAAGVEIDRLEVPTGSADEPPHEPTPAP
jgi:hypothetical protein